MDILSRWIGSTLLRLYHDKIGHRLHDLESLPESQIPIIHYSDRNLGVTVDVISTILSSLVPTMSILALSFVQIPLARTAAIIAFSSLFSVVLRVNTKAGRIECFLATAAFATAASFLVVDKGL
jgi:hypothetical protein